MRRVLISLVVILIALVVLLGLGFERLVDGMLRPWAETTAASALDSEVRIERLELSWGRLELATVQVTRPSAFRVTVEQVEVRYSVAGLLRRRLDSVVVRQPDVEWNATGAAGGEPILWPKQPPLRVGIWNIEQGRLLVTMGEERLLLRQLEAAGNLDSRFAVEAAARLGDEPGERLAIAGHGTWEGRLELTVSQLLWSGRSLLQAPVTVAPDGELPGFSLALAQLDDKDAGRLLAALGRELPWPPELAWVVSAPRLTVGIVDEHLSLLLESAAGEVRRQGERWQWEGLRLQLLAVDGRYDVNAELALPAGSRLHVNGTWRDERFDGPWRFSAPAPARLAQALGIELPPPADQLHELMLSGELQAAVRAVTVARARLVARLQGGGELSGALSARWRGSAVSIEANDLGVWQAGRRLATAALSVTGRPAEADWQGTWRLQLPDALQLSRALAIDVPAEVPNLQGLELQGLLAMPGGRLSLPKIEVNGQIVGAGLDGGLSGTLAARQVEQGWRFDVARLAATDVAYLSADGLSGVSGGALQLAGTLTWQEELTFALRGEAGAGEALAGSYYADFGGLPLRLMADGVWVPVTGRVNLQASRLDLAGLVTARLQGSVTGERLELNGEISAPRLDGAFQERLRQVVTGILPEPQRLELAGSLSASVTAGWRPEGWMIEATVRPAGVTLAWGETLRLDGLSGELPIMLQPGPAVTSVERPGALRWDALRAGPIVSNDGRFLLAAGANSWRLREPLRLAAGGGWLEVNGLALTRTAAGAEMRASLRATAIEMAEVSRAFDWPEMGGRLTAELPDIRFAGEQISTGGEALLQVFDGTVRVRNMQINQPFSRYPTYQADLDFSGIDLKLLTQAFAFGEINGVADGFVHHLRLFGLVPSAFDATFETRLQGTRTISVKAIRNFNAFSQGGLSAVLSQGIYRFIDVYRYRKIGIRCWLQNDLFHLEGTARPGTTSYLIDGGWLPPRIDVIVSSPTISFQEMVKRLKRIEHTGN